MDYQTPSRNQKKKSSTDSTSRKSPSTYTDLPVSESASVKYYTAVAKSTKPYRSPYTEDTDRHLQPPSRTSTTLSASRSATTSHKAPSPLTKDSLSTYSSSSGDSLYTSSPTHRGHSSRKMSSSKGKTMSSVSHFLDLSVVRHTLSSAFRR